MNKVVKYIIKYVKFFVVYLAITFLANEFLGWFQGDSLLRNASAITIMLAIIDGLYSLLKKQILKGEQD